MSNKLSSTKRDHLAGRFEDSHFQSHANWPSTRRPRILPTVAYGSLAADAFSGTTYYLSLAGINSRQLEGCFSLPSAQNVKMMLRLHGLVWRLGTMARGRKAQGFKFTAEYNRVLWQNSLDILSDSTIVNNFQLFSPVFFKGRAKHNIGACFYIDGTLTEYFESYASYDTANIDDVTITEAIRAEKAGYEQADLIAVMSKRTARTLVERYGIKPARIRVIAPGANLPDSVADAVSNKRSLELSDDFVVGFVGLYPLRKGLDRLVNAVKILRSRRLPIRVQVIGNCPEELASVEGVDYIGRINKNLNPAAFAAAISRVDVGCLLSRAELAGIAVVEFLRLGIPVIGTDVGGTTDILEGGGSIMLSASAPDEEIAETLQELYENRGLYSRLRAEAIGRKEWARWNRVTAELNDYLP